MILYPSDFVRNQATTFLIMDFNNLFIDNREEGETPIKQCQLVMLRLLKIFDYLCTKHNIQYFLIGGSLLGAIRHQGFIPWDDDLDVGMTRENYEKFINLAVKELPIDIFFQNPDTDPYYPSCSFVEAKLRDKFSHYTRDKYKYHDGIQLDIFVYDKAFLPHNFFIITQNYLLKLLNDHKKRAIVLNWIAKNSPFKLVYAHSYLHSFGALKLGTNYMTETEVTTLIKVRFEDLEICIPQNWHDCLERQYGNYMQLPPVEKQSTHHGSLPDPFSPCVHTEILYWKHI